MSAKVLSAAVVGLDASLVEVEADISRGLPKTFIVGLPDTAVQEAKERVRSGIRNSGFDFPPSVITVNLAPAHLRKEGSGYDLPIAVAILLARGILKKERTIDDALFIGELSLDGTLRPVNGVLSIAIAARKQKIKKVFLPKHNATEASLVKGVHIYPVESLSQLILHLENKQHIDPFKRRVRKDAKSTEHGNDMSHVRGQEQAKRALEIAAAGGHNVLMTGPPGSGKTLLARTMATILPSMTFEESLEVTKIYSVAGQLSGTTAVISERPFRAPHHTTSSVALVGGGSFPKPGEISLAHRGILFLDEFAEFPRAVLESLRQPLEDGMITVSRAAGSVQFPARFTLIAARNPCPCGYYNDPRQECTCSPHTIINYQKKISGPLLDRIDMHIAVPRLEYDKIAAPPTGERSCTIQKRVEHARAVQSQRFMQKNISYNTEMSIRHIDVLCPLEQAASELLKEAVNKFFLSARAFHRIIKVARTIADLESQKMITSDHIAEALQYRPQAG